MNFRAGNSSSMTKGRIDSARRILNTSIAALRYFGLWAAPANSTGMFKLFYAFYNKLMLGLVFSFAGTIIADLCANYQNLTIVTDDGCFIAGVGVIVFKLFNFQLRRKRIDNLIGAVHDPVDTLQRSTDQAVINLLRNFVLYEKTMVYFFRTLGGFLVVALMILAPTEEGSLPIRSKYPLDTTKRSTYEIVFVIQASAITTAMVAIMAMDGAVLGICTFTDFQLEVLNANYKNCQISSAPRARLETPRGLLTMGIFRPEQDVTIRSFVPFDSKEVNVADDNFSKRFITCVRHHQRLIKIVDDVNDIFGSSMLVQLCASSSMICLTGFQIVLGAKDSSNLMKFVVYLGTAFSQIFCWCWFGNRLIYQSNRLATSQWFSGWEEERDFSMVAVLMTVSLIRSRRLMELKAGSFFNLSMETFIAVLRSSYSIFALLTTVNEPIVE